MSRRGRGGLSRIESPPPINRYAGDWSICGRDLVSGQEADYDEVAGSESDTGKQIWNFSLKCVDTCCLSEMSLLFQAVGMKTRRKRRKCGPQEEVCTWTTS